MSSPICRILTDSCCDLPRELLVDAGVDVLSFPFIMSDGEHRDDLGASMSPDEFYRRIQDEGELPSTAQIPMPDITAALESAASSGVPTVYLGFSSGLSGTFATVEMIVDDVRSRHPEAELYLVDTMLASIAQGALVLEAIARRDSGASAAEIAEWASDARFRVHGYFILDGLEHLSRGGRLPEIAAAAGAKLDVKPMLRFSTGGKLAFEKVVRGRRKSIRALAEMTAAIDPAGPRTLVVASAAAEPDADRLEEMLAEAVPERLVVRSHVGPVIGSHVGPGMVALAFWGPDRRDGGALANAAAGVAKGAANAAAEVVKGAASAASNARDAADAARDAAGAARDALRSRFGRGDDEGER